jgi:hypothetical protein
LLVLRFHACVLTIVRPLVRGRHHADGYCFPCDAAQPQCKGGVGPSGLCAHTGQPQYDSGYRAVVGAIYGAAGGASNVTVQRLLVSGPYLRAFSIASAWSLFGKNPVGSLHDWRFGAPPAGTASGAGARASKPPDVGGAGEAASLGVVFSEMQEAGFKSKIWATGPGFSHPGGDNKGTVYGISFLDLSIGGVRVTAANRAQHFALADECDPLSSYGDKGNVRAVTFGQ